ncbi:MAG: hypothetical protein KAR35_04915, partial [Candidatus Heimdallarchaeota archaeon]|nr:hypothetical protein [Candidatus Heimdallarchaeota archaeon]MCK5048697.1 hypothetical protein [Candidatus Heimdallarchaeota archaeon]
SGNYVTEIVWITIEDSINPAIDSPDDISYKEGEIGNTLSWTATDLDAGNYIIYQNGTELVSGTWTSGTEVVFNGDGLLAGVYNFTIVVSDQTGNIAYDTVIITVTEVADDPKDDSNEDNGITIIIVITVIVIIGGVGVGVFIYLRRKK